MAEQTISVVAALPEEVRCVRRRHGLRRRAGPGVTWLGSLAGEKVSLSCTGVGLAGAEAGIKAVLDRDSPRALIFIGLAGALSADLSVGELVVAERVALAEDPKSAIPVPASSWLRRAGTLSGARVGTIWSAPRIFSTASEKRALAGRIATGPNASVIDMESYAWARAASRAGLPFVVLRAVSDGIDEDLPPELHLALRPSGSLSRASLAGAALRRPRLIWELLDLRDRVRTCSRALEQALVSVLA